MGRKILLVEDDRETAAYLAKGLTQEGHSVEQATNGQDGLFRATDGSFDLIILDRMLPALDGLSVLKALARGADRDARADPLRSGLGRRPDRRAGMRLRRLSGEALLLRRAAGPRERAAPPARIPHRSRRSSADGRRPGNRSAVADA